MNQTIRLLGLDPALRNTGFAVMDYRINSGELDLIAVDIVKTVKSKDHKVVRQTSDDLACARSIVSDLKRIVSIHKPALVISEVPGFSQSARGAFTNGVVCGVLGSLVVPVIEVSTIETKQAAGGTKTSSKAFMIEWAVARWPRANWLTRKYKGNIELLGENEHMADACAVAVAGTMTPPFAQAVALMQSMRAIA